MERELSAVAGSAVHHIEPQCLQAARARARGGAMGDDLERNPPAVQRQDELVGETGRIARLPNVGTHLVRRDLGDIERVADVHVTPGDLDPRVVVDREVAEWVRLGECRGDERSCQGAAQRGQDECDAAPHEGCSPDGAERFGRTRTRRCTCLCTAAVRRA